MVAIKIWNATQYSVQLNISTDGKPYEGGKLMKTILSLLLTYGRKNQS